MEPGYYAEMNGEDITESVQIKGSVDVNTPGIYNLVYAAYNEDGLPKHLHEQYMWQIILLLL